ncbi:MAG: hypothetical protein F4Z40_01110 [Chloroflexi bacterium]|nr:hypothetical protein [Chloroflexota bacterium]
MLETFSLARSIHCDGEFDPGSGLTLAACLINASRTVRTLRCHDRGVRVSNTWVICLFVGDNPGKPGTIPHTITGMRSGDERFIAERGARGRLACWRGKSPPRLRSIAGLRG